LNESEGLPRWDTRILPAYESPGSETPSAHALAEATRSLERGIPVVIPTETVYGLAALALRREAVEAIFGIKGRPLDNPLIVHVAGLDQLASIGAELSSLAARLAHRFWPGPLTLIVNARLPLPWVTAGLDSIAVRQPAHPFAAALIRRTGPLAAPSANLSGRPSPTRARDARLDLLGRVPLIVDGGDLEHGLESTVLDARGDVPVLLRPGALSLEAIEATGEGGVEACSTHATARSPGMKYRHYSPRAELWLYPPSSGLERRHQLTDDARQLRSRGSRVAAIAEHPLDVDHFIQAPADAQELGHHLFAWLRDLDELGMEYILVEGVSSAGVGRAVMDRLERAALRIRRLDDEAARHGRPAS
jgi:L-threonylcarbamoyladenylate synthase